MLASLKKYHTLLLIIILAFAFFTRIYRLDNPERYIFDEVYHAHTAKLIARNDPRAYEWWHGAIEPNTAVDWLHPPLAKYTQAFFILVFGENSFGWRFSSVIFGVAVIAATYKLAQLLFENQNLSLLAAGLASLDGLLLTQSRIAMNDIHVTFFILLALFFYWKYRKNKTKAKYLLLTSLAAGLAMSSKWSGLFSLVIIWLFEVLDLAQNSLAKFSIKRIISKLATIIFFFLFIPVLIYIASYSHMFFQGKTFKHFIQLHQQIWWYQTGLEATHPYQSRPWQWFLNLRPVWFHVDYSVPEKLGNIYAFGNTTLFWFGGLAVIISLFYLVKQIVKTLKNRASARHGKKTQAKKLKISNQLIRLLKIFPNPLIYLFFAYLLVWTPWFASPRIMFFYHYTPAIPLLSIILAYWLIKLNKVKISSKELKAKNFPLGTALMILIICLITINFEVWYPNWTGIVMPKEFVNKVYFAIKSWK